MKSVLIVALGGAMGSVLRYLLSAWALQHSVGWRFPVGTFAVNVLGCALVGVLAGLLVKHHVFSPEVRLFLFTGLAGGFTTFSAFGLETFNLIRRDEVLIAGSYVVSSVVIGLVVLWLGFSLVSARG
ncbi:fluoride efflux transporter CrcB [Wenzhouxiangella limi]|uniref:Fluoride-specific ion channel FluC n=1 Tax=Wenzhouxiangella limi TaxID=2707351 RepID=A0A845US02_9GAMM|nr:fluoride efflux transporter CrcB [Wenzhouxiangella limi]NDY94347.1 fluoride efflux transporter CrcB [Wenzhouxiangella limi]